MDCVQTGKLIAALRREQGMTQRQVAERLHVSVQAVSKWERGLGCPEVGLLADLAHLFGVQAERLLAGDLDPNDLEVGNMRKLNIYVCPACGNILTATGKAELSCCGRKLDPLEATPVDPIHQAKIEEVEDEYYLTFSHPMEKGHFLRFVACVGIDRFLLVRMYPEQEAALRIPHMRGKLLMCCNQDGLFEQEL